jgi:hypothetical protein
MAEDHLAVLMLKVLVELDARPALRGSRWSP